MLSQSNMKVLNLKSKWWTNTHWAQLIKFRFKCLSLHNNGNILMHICHRRRHCHMCVIINVFWVDYCGNLSFEWNTQVAKLNSQKITKAKKIVKHSINFQLKQVLKWENRTHIKLHHPNNDTKEHIYESIKTPKYSKQKYSDKKL